MKSISAATIALSLIIGSLTSAHADGRDYDRHEYAQQHADRDHRDPPDRWDDWNHRDHDDRWDRHDGHDDSNHGYGNRNDRDYRRDYVQGRYDAGRYIRPHGFYQRAWHRGERLPPAYYSNRYVVRNYSAYRLRSPPRGYQWVRVERDVVLTAVTTGVIVAVVGDLFG
jgi:Ni/Co efflux regulator RcnB